MTYPPNLLKLDPAFRVLLPEGATGATGELDYQGPYRVAAVLAGGTSDVKVVIPDPAGAPRLGQVVALDGSPNVFLLGARPGDPVPPYLTLRLYPEFPLLANAIDRGEPIILSGRPHEHPEGSGLWDLEDLGGDARPTIASRAQIESVSQVLADYGLILPNLASATAQLQGVLAELADTQADIEQSKDAILATANSVPYANLAAFPPSNIATRGAIAGDTGFVYSPGGATWGAPVAKIATGAAVIAAQATADAATAKLVKVNQTTETVINAGYFGLQGYPNDDTTAFLAAHTAALALGVRRIYVPAAPAGAFNPDAPVEFRKPHYLTAELPADPDFEWYGDGLGLTNIRTTAKNQRNLYFGESPNTATLYPNFRIRDLLLWGRADEFVGAHGPGEEHYSLLTLSGFRDFSIERVGTLAPRGDGIGLVGGDNFSPGAALSFMRHNRNGKISGYVGDGYNYLNRNGLTIIDCDGLTVEDLDLRRYTHSGMPGAVDIEPNNPQSIVKNLVFNRGFIQSAGTNGVFGMYLNAALASFTQIRGIRMRDYVIDGTNPFGQATVAVQFHANGETVAGDDLGVDMEFTPQNVARPFILKGSAGVRLGGKWAGITNASIVGNFESPGTKIPRNTTIDATISQGEGVLLVATAGFLNWLPVLDNTTSGLRMYAGGSSSGVNIAPRALIGAGTVAASKDVTHTANAATTKFTPPATATAAQKTINVPYAIDPVLPRASVAVNVDLNSAAAYADKFPVGLSFVALNGCTNAPGGRPQGGLMTLIDNANGADGVGWSWQMFTRRGGQNGVNSTAWIRFGSELVLGVTGPWGGWQRMGYTPSPAPAAVDVVTALTVSATPTQAEVQAVINRVIAYGNSINNHRAALIAAGVET